MNKHLISALLALFFISCAGKGAVPATVTDDPTLPSVHLNGVDFHGEAFGDPANPVVIVLHGGPGQDYVSLLDLKELSDEYYVVFYDQRGSGLSERVMSDAISMEYFISDLDAFVEYYGQGRCSLVGHSWGAMLATAYTARYPEKVETLVIAEPGFLDQVSFDWFMDASGMKDMKITGSMVRAGLNAFRSTLRMDLPDRYAFQDAFYITLLINIWSDDNPMAGYFRDSNMMNGDMRMNRMGALVSQTMMQSVADKEGNLQIDFVSGLEDYTGKTLLITGSENSLTGGEHQEYYLRFFQHAELVTVDAGHTMFSENPDAVIPLVREHLDSKYVD